MEESPPDRATLRPEDPAGPFRVTVPTDETPPKTEEGEKVRLETRVGVNVRVALFTDGPSMAVNVSASDVETSEVETVKVALLPFAGIDTVAG